VRQQAFGFLSLQVQHLEQIIEERSLSVSTQNQPAIGR
jgi:hypothetical protein